MVLKLMKYMAPAALILLVAACSNRPQVVPDDVLKDIFHDAYIANAYLDEANINDDSLYIYEPIFERYGYSIKDFHYTIMTFSERKSAMLSDLIAEVNDRLSREARIEARKMMVLDTIDNIAKRTYTRTVYSDSLIRVKRMRDTSKLRIKIEDIVPAEYTITFTYLIDTLDENYNSRVEAHLMTKDTQEVFRHTMMLTRYREAKYSRKFKTDSSHKELHIDMFYHPNHEESKLPDITIKEFKVVRVLPTEQSVDSLYHHQLNLRMFNHALMTAFTADTLEVVMPADTLTTDSLRNEKDSLTLRTN